MGRKIISLFLVLAMCLSFVPSIYAIEPTGNIDLSTSGRICITDTGYITNYDGTYDSSNETAYTGPYKITGAIDGDTPIEIRSNSNDNTELDIWLEDVDIKAFDWCTAVRIHNMGLGDLQINFYLEGTNTIISAGYPPFYVAEGNDVSVDLYITSITYDYTFYNVMPEEHGALFNDDGRVTSFKLLETTRANEAIDTVGHTCSSLEYEYDNIEHYAVCDHYPMYRIEDHNGSATCTSQAHCSVCNQDYGEIDVNAHDWSIWTDEDDNTHIRSCINDPTHIERGNHSGDYATCKMGEVCLVCGREYTEPDTNNHAWSTWFWDVTDFSRHRRMCSNNPIEHVEYAAHTFVDDVCTICYLPDTSDYANVITSNIEITGTSGSLPGVTWNTIEDNGVTYINVELDSVITLASLILPNNSGNDTEVITINVKSDSRVFGGITFENNNQRGLVTIQGDGKLEANAFNGTGNGDRLNIYTDVEIKGDLFLGASGGMDSHLEISGATLEVDGDTVLIEELELSSLARFIVHGHLSMHNTPIFDLEDECEIAIMGDGNPSFYVESDTEPSWYSNIVSNKTLPIGYTMQVDSDTNYFSLHDDQGNLVTGTVILRNKLDYRIRVVNDDTKSSYTVTTGLYGANSIYTIENDTVILDVLLNSSEYTIDKVTMVTDASSTELTEYSPGQYRFIMPDTSVRLEITYANAGGGTPPSQSQPIGGDSDPSYRIDIADDISNGEIDSNRNYAESGDWVKLTATPDNGYILDKLTVTDRNGKKIDIEKDGDIYKFKMPSGKVFVDGEFVKSGIYHSENCDRGESCPIWRFDDTNAHAWYHDGTHYCIDEEIMVGYGDRVFKPDASVTRAMVVTMLWRMENAPIVNYLMSYEDIDLGQWYTEAVRWASSEKIVSGYSSKEFGPNDIMTREQMVSVLHRYAQYKGLDVSVGEDTNILSYNDIFEVSEYAIPAMQWACGEGIIKGDNGNLMPKDSTTRVQVANILFRYFKL